MMARRRHFDDHNHRASRNESRAPFVTGATQKRSKISSLIGQIPDCFFSDSWAARGRKSSHLAAPSSLWKVIVIPTIITGYAAALLLIYNAAASIFGFTQWP
jgi:hypothetical protein